VTLQRRNADAPQAGRARSPLVKARRAAR
jgi:hypothetical protein